MRGSNSKNNNNDNNNQAAAAAAAAVTDWEVRPGGMLVQKREDEVGSGPAAAGGPMINIKVCHGTSQLDLSVPAQSTFGELKRVLAKVTGLEPQDQRLLFRGKEKDSEECLHMAGVKDMSKMVLLEDPASKERKLEQLKMEQGVSKACEAVVLVRSEVDKLAEKVTALESAVHGGTKVEEKEFIMLTELLMVLLLKLDGIEAEGEAKVQRRMEIFILKKQQRAPPAPSPLSHSSRSLSLSLSLTLKQCNEGGRRANVLHELSLLGSLPSDIELGRIVRHRLPKSRTGPHRHAAAVPTNL